MSVNGTHLEAQMGALLSSVILPHHALEMPCAGYGRAASAASSPTARAPFQTQAEHLSRRISPGVRLACCAVGGDRGNAEVLPQPDPFGRRDAGFVHDPIFSVCGAAVDIGTTTLASCLYGPDGTLLARRRAESAGGLGRRRHLASRPHCTATCWPPPCAPVCGTGGNGRFSAYR
ncbi:MAG: hypothetical protein ACLRRT_14230 [Ruthenibacterium lactatiformans]